MSEVISFRLNNKNMQEAHALEILKGQLRRGYSMRQIMVGALFLLEQEQKPSVDLIETYDLTILVLKINKLIALLEPEETHNPQQNNKIPQNEVSSEFISDIRSNVKLGLRVEEKNLDALSN